MFGSMRLFPQSNPTFATCEPQVLKGALNQQVLVSWTIKESSVLMKNPEKKNFPTGGICLWAVSLKG